MNEKQAKWERRERERGRERGSVARRQHTNNFRSILLGPSPFVCVSVPLCLSPSISFLAMNVNFTHWRGAFGENAKML